MVIELVRLLVAGHNLRGAENDLRPVLVLNRQSLGNKTMAAAAILAPSTRLTRNATPRISTIDGDAQANVKYATNLSKS